MLNRSNYAKSRPNDLFSENHAGSFVRQFFATMTADDESSINTAAVVVKTTNTAMSESRSVMLHSLTLVWKWKI
jgi:hypothetical protein